MMKTLCGLSLYLGMLLFAMPAYADARSNVQVSVIVCDQDAREEPSLAVTEVAKEGATPILHTLMSAAADGSSVASISLSPGYYWFEPRTTNCGFAQAVAVLGATRYVTMVLEPRTVDANRDDYLDLPLGGAVAGQLTLPGLRVVCVRLPLSSVYRDKIALVFDHTYYVDSLAPGDWEIKVEGTGWVSRPIAVTVPSGGLLIRNITRADLANPFYFHHLH